MRIFVSAPADVVPERRRAKLIIEKLAKSYARFFKIEPILWEIEPMLASGHFQDQITPPGETEIVVLIVWSRLGTPLPEKTHTREYRGIDGRAPVTGTEWEFEDAIAGYKRGGAPDLLAYRKQADLIVCLHDKTAMAAAKEQWDKLEAFWTRWFVTRDDFGAAFNAFADLDEFEARLDNDLRRLIDRRIQVLLDANKAAPTLVWTEGSPFKGLEAYRFEHAPVFFGRSAVTRTAVEQLTGNAENGRAFLLILGASGAGKSSLAQAGILPSLTGRGIMPGVGLWRRSVMRPAGHSGGPFAGLAQALVNQMALPELLTGNQDTAALARHLKASIDDPAYTLVAALDQIEMAARASGDLLTIETARLALVVDQLEELFTGGNVTATERTAFIRCLDGLAKSGRVFVIATMRSDYWHRAAATPPLVEMAARSGKLDLLSATQDEIFEIIRQPAEAAGIDFETDPVRHIRLDATLATEAANEPGALPLLSFLLDELYKKDISDRGRSTLTFASMKELGGLKGAIANQAEAIFTALPSAVQSALPKVLRALVMVSRSGADPTASPVPIDRFRQGSPERQLVERLLDPQVRLLVAEGDGAAARIRLAHEALITHWKRAKDQIIQDRDDLRTRAAIEEAFTEYRNAQYRKAPTSQQRKYLLRDPLLANAVDLAARWADDFENATLAFIQSSRARARLRYQLTLAAAAIFALVAVGAAVAAQQAFEQRHAAVSSLELARTGTEELVSFIATDLRTIQGIRVETLLRLLERAKASFNQLSSAIGDDPSFQRYRAKMMSEFGDAFLKTKDRGLDQAYQAYNESLQIYRNLAAKDPNENDWQHGIADQTEHIGLVRQQEGELDSAMDNFRQASDIRHAIATREPASATSYRQLAWSYYNIGEIWMARGMAQKSLESDDKALEYMQRALSIDTDNLDLEYRRSRIHVSIGVAYNALGDHEKRLASLETALGIRKQLVGARPDNAEWKRDLAWAYFWIADYYLDAANLDKALENSERCMSLRLELAKANPGDFVAKYDLAWAYHTLGTTFGEKGDPAAAERNFKEAYKLRSELVELDEKNTRWRKDLALSHETLGDLANTRKQAISAIAEYKSAIAIMNELVSAAPTNGGWRNALAKIYNKLGLVQKCQGRVEDSLLSYQEALAIRSKLLDENPNDLATMLSAATSEKLVGEVLHLRGEVETASAHYRQTVELAKRLLERDPKNKAAQDLLSIGEKRVERAVDADPDDGLRACTSS